MGQGATKKSPTPQAAANKPSNWKQTFTGGGEASAVDTQRRSRSAEQKGSQTVVSSLELELLVSGAASSPNLGLVSLKKDRPGVEHKPPSAGDLTAKGAGGGGEPTRPLF